ncbi:MAG: tRNA pseudouridine(38-40) synthase TruA [Salibacteraceae bacterium]
MNEAFSTIIREDVYTVGCGRTDTGVHAKKFYAHFDLPGTIENLPDIVFKANCVLPKEVAVHRIFECDPDLHARFSAEKRVYQYLISTSKNPFMVHRAFEYREPLNLDAMNDACSILVKHKDFTSFAKLHGDSETNLCDIFMASWTESPGKVQFEISANRFLRNMVRAIVGTMIELGIGKINLDQFEGIIEAKDRSAAGYSVPAHGLYLTDIHYPAKYNVA